MYRFTLDNVSQSHLSFLRSLLLYLLASLMAFSGQWKLKSTEIFSPYSPPCLMRLPVAKMSKMKWTRDRNINTIMEIFVTHEKPPLLYSENWQEPQQQHSLVGSFLHQKHAPTNGFQIIIQTWYPLIYLL